MCHVRRSSGSQGRQTGCTLTNLSEEDKTKVAKLIRQVVELEDELRVRRQREQVSQASSLPGGIGVMHITCANCHCCAQDSLQVKALLGELQDRNKGTMQENAMCGSPTFLQILAICNSEGCKLLYNLSARFGSAGCAPSLAKPWRCCAPTSTRYG